MRSDLRIADLRRRDSSTSKLMNVKIPAALSDAIDKMVGDLGVPKTDVVIALLNEGLDRSTEMLRGWRPKTVVLPNRSYIDDVTAESLRNLWPIDFSMYLEHVGVPCIMKPAFGGGWKNVHKIHSLDELLHHYNESATLTMMLQEFVAWDTYVRVPTIGRRFARAIRYDPAPGGLGGYDQDYEALPRALRERAEELSLRFNVALGYDMNALEFAVKDGKFYGIDLTNYTPDLDYRSLKDAHFPWAVEKMASFAIEKALSAEPTPAPPDWKRLLLP